MSKNNIAQQYNSMVASIEDAKIYDGRGEYNLYECNKCNNYKVTLFIIDFIHKNNTRIAIYIQFALHELSSFYFLNYVYLHCSFFTHIFFHNLSNSFCNSFILLSKAYI